MRLLVERQRTLVAWDEVHLWILNLFIENSYSHTGFFVNHKKGLIVLSCALRPCFLVVHSQLGIFSDILAFILDLWINTFHHDNRINFVYRWRLLLLLLLRITWHNLLVWAWSDARLSIFHVGPLCEPLCLQPHAHLVFLSTVLLQVIRWELVYNFVYLFLVFWRRWVSRN